MDSILRPCPGRSQSGPATALVGLFPVQGLGGWHRQCVKFGTAFGGPAVWVSFPPAHDAAQEDDAADGVARVALRAVDTARPQLRSLPDGKP